MDSTLPRPSSSFFGFTLLPAAVGAAALGCQRLLAVHPEMHMSASRCCTILPYHGTTISDAWLGSVAGDSVLLVLLLLLLLVVVVM